MVYTVIDREEPRGQSVADDGIPCTARTCCTRLNILERENEQLRNELETYKSANILLKRTLDEKC